MMGPMRVRGRSFFLILILVTVAASLGLFLVFRHSVRERFAIGVYAQGETPDLKKPRKLWFIDLNRKQPLPRKKPLVVWIEGGTAGKKDLKGIVYLLGDQGELLWPPQELVLKKNAAGKQVEETIFPPPDELHAGKSLGVVVARLPRITEEIKEEFVVKTSRARTQLERIAQMKQVCSRNYGALEYAILYVASPKD